MIKNGEVRTVQTPCDICGKPAESLFESAARCADHTISSDKEASLRSGISLKSFTESLEA